jgi:hypothetical protein
MRIVICVALVATSCTEVRNPAYCERDADCKNGNTCNVDTHACDVVPVDGAPNDEDLGPLVARTVQQVRDPLTPVDTPVELSNVIVTAIDLYGNRIGELWVQQPGGGMYSGVKVFGTDPADFGLLAVGDVVSVLGGKKAFFTNASDLSGRKEIQVAPMQTLHVTKLGNTATPVIAGMDWLTISNQTGPELDEARERWAGALVRVMTITAMGAPTQIAADPTLTQFPVPAFFVQSLLSAFPGGIDNGTCFASITGVVEYNHNYNIQPRTTADVVVGCP